MLPIGLRVATAHNGHQLVVLNCHATTSTPNDRNGPECHNHFGGRPCESVVEFGGQCPPGLEAAKTSIASFTPGVAFEARIICRRINSLREVVLAGLRFGNELLQEIQDSARSNNGRPDYDKIRRDYLTKLHAHTGRDTILYATCFANREASQPITSIVDEDMTGLMTVVHRLRSRKLDLILHSPGGSIEAAESIVEYLRLKFKNIRVIVPQLALSAATIIACGADSVVLGKHSFLGPIDPQILVQTQLGARYVPAQAILEQFEKAVQECENPKRLAAWIPMLSQYGPHLLVACENATDLSKTLVTDWLGRWMLKKNPDRKKQADKIAHWLSDHKQHKSHGRHIPRSKLKAKGFAIEFMENDQVFQDLVLSVHHATTHTFAGTGAGKIIENHLGRAFVKLIQQVQVPIQIPVPHPGPNPAEVPVQPS